MGNLVIAKMTGTLPPGTPEELAGPAEAPVRQKMRFASLDVLRGFALLGILILNIENFAGYEALMDFPVGLIKPAFVGWHAHLDFAIVILKWVFAEGKMRGLFSLLFGAGAVLLTERIERRGETGRAAVVFYRRNFWLLLFGICHGFLIWFGDILFPYAVLGLIFLYPLRRLAARKLIIVGLTIWLVGGTFVAYASFTLLTCSAAMPTLPRPGPRDRRRLQRSWQSLAPPKASERLSRRAPSKRFERAVSTMSPDGVTAWPMRRA